jgi:hypothetical protein
MLRSLGSRLTWVAQREHGGQTVREIEFIISIAFFFSSFDCSRTGDGGTVRWGMMGVGMVVMRVYLWALVYSSEPKHHI